MRLRRLARSAWGAACIYAIVTVALTWPLAGHVAHDLPGDLVDPLFSCWVLGWNFHVFGLSNEGWRAASYWDANIFFPTRASLARSEHFLPQALLGAPVYALTHDLVLTYNLLFLATFVLSGTFFYLLARDETGDHSAALGAGLLFGFALFRWAQVMHLQALSSQWMPLALLFARRTARAVRSWPAAGWILALGAVSAIQVLSSGYYLLFFPPFLAIWAAIEARRAGSVGAWLRLAAAAAVAIALALPMVLPYVALGASGARRDLDVVVANSADVLSWLAAPELTLVWGRIVRVFPRGEAQLFPGIVTPVLAAIALAAAVRAAREGAAAAREAAAARDVASARDAASTAPGPTDTGVAGADASSRARVAARVTAVLLAAVGVAGALAVALGGVTVAVGSFHLRAIGALRPAMLLAAACLAALAGWPRLRPILRLLLRRREVLAMSLAALAAWLSLGPRVTWGGWPASIPSAYWWLYEYVPGFAAGRVPARFAMIAACFGALAAAWGLKHLRATPAGRRWASIACGAFVLETASVPLPLDAQGFFLAGPYQWELPDLGSMPEWHGGAPSPIVAAVRQLPNDAVLAALPMGEAFHETRAMFDSAYHWRRMLNGYSSWIPSEYVDHVVALRDPLRNAPGTLAALRAAGVTHAIVHEGAWGARGKGRQVTGRLTAAGARPVARAGDVVLLAVR